MKFDPQNHHRRSIRLKEYDYTQPGAYFVTMVTWRRDEILGEVVNGVMRLNGLGEIAFQEWFKTEQMRSNVELDPEEFVVMPNHVHGIIKIVNVGDVGADGVRPGPDEIKSTGASDTYGEGVQDKGARGAPLRRVGGSLGSVIAGFKAAVTSRAGRELNSANIWQRNYYEHIIRSEGEFKTIRDYIETNPMHWQDDQLHPAAPPNRFNQEKL